MWNQLKRWFANRSHDHAFPREVKEHWYCGEWYLHVSALRESRRRNLTGD